MRVLMLALLEARRVAWCVHVSLGEAPRLRKRDVEGEGVRLAAAAVVAPALLGRARDALSDVECECVEAHDV